MTQPTDNANKGSRQSIENGTNNVQSDGDFSSIIQGGVGANSIVIQGGGLIEQLFLASSNVDWNKLGQMMGFLTKVTDVHQDFRIGLNPQGQTITFTPNETKLVEVAFVLELPESFEHCETPEDVLMFSHFQQIPIEGRIISSKTRIGGTVIDEYASSTAPERKTMFLSFSTSERIELHNPWNSGEVFERQISIPPIPFPPPVRVVFECPQTNRSLSTSLQTSKVDIVGSKRRTLLLTNESHAEAEFDVSLVATIPDDPMDTELYTNFTMSLRNDQSNYRSLRYFEFLLDLGNSQELVVRAEPSGREILRYTADVLTEEQLTQAAIIRDILVKSLEIERKLDVKLPCIVTILDEKVHSNIEFLYESVTFGKVNQICVDSEILNVQLDLDTFFSLNKDSEILNSITGHQESSPYLIGDVSVDLGECIILMPPVRIENFNEIKAMGLSGDGKVAKAELSFIDSPECMLIFPRFYGETDAQRIVVKEQWNI